SADRRAGFDAMTVLATQSLSARVSGVTEIEAIGFRPHRRVAESAQPVARVARRDVLPGCAARVRRVTLEAGDVRVRARRDRERDSAPFALMTGDAACAGASRAHSVPRVLESDGETLERRE